MASKTSTAQRDEKGRLKKGSVINPRGRQKGSKNRFTVEIKEMVEKALHDAGGTAYLTQQAQENPVAFMGLVGKIIPNKVDVDFKVMSQEVVGVLEQRKQKLQELREMRDITPKEEEQ